MNEDDLILHMMAAGFQFDGSVEGRLYFRRDGETGVYISFPQNGDHLKVGTYHYHKESWTPADALTSADITEGHKEMAYTIKPDTAPLTKIEILVGTANFVDLAPE